MLQKLNVPRHHPGPRDIAPTPEFWRGWAGHARNGRHLTFSADRDFLAFGSGKRAFAGLTITVAGQEVTWVFYVRTLGAFDPISDPFSKLRNVRRAQGRERDSLPLAVNRDRLQG